MNDGPLRKAPALARNGGKPWSRFAIASLLLASQAWGEGKNPWAEARTPSAGPARAIGETNNGCMAGAATLATEGEGYAVMHLERRRHFGHPNLVRTIRSLGTEAAHGLGELHVGDLSMPRGGPMPFGHRSHQTGLDADVWFDLRPNLLARADRQRSNIPAPSLLVSAAKGLDYGLWNRNHERLLHAVAVIPEVDRVFVNAHIKRELCRSVRGERGWLRKIRPWYHHDDHFHLRLACPPDSPACVRQEPIPAGDGCDASLDWWFQPHPADAAKPAPALLPVLPAACRALAGAD